MNILVLDFLFPEGHRYINNNIIKCLSNIANVDVFAKEDYYKEYKDGWNNVRLEEFSVSKKALNRNSTIVRKIESASMMAKSKRKIQSQPYDCVVVLSFDTLAMALCKLYFASKKMFIIHHKNIDDLCRKRLNSLVFRTYMNDVHHVVFENVFKHYLVNKIGVTDERVHVIPHPVGVHNFDNRFHGDSYDCVALSQSNDEAFLREIIEYESKSRYFKTNNLKIVLRSKHFRFDDGHLQILNGFLPTSVYNEYILKASTVFVPLPESFKYRVSGTIYDAFSMHKTVLTNNEIIVAQCEQRYPGICFKVDNVRDFCFAVKNIKGKKEYKEQFEKFNNDHSMESVSNRFLIGLLESMNISK